MILFACLLGIASAQDTFEVDQSITVYGEKESDRLMRQLHRQLKSMGYQTAIKKGDKLIFEPIIQWKPTLIFSDEGLVTIKRSKPRFQPWIGGQKDNLWRYLSCIPPFTPMCIQMQSWFLEKRKFDAVKSKVIGATQKPISDWQEAIASEAHEERIGELLPNELTTLWSSAEKSKASEHILSMWANRTCTDEGEEARTVIGDFIHSVIQASPHAITAKRLRDTEESCLCEGRQRLDKTAVIE